MISGVNSVHSLRTRKIGSAISADVHVQVDPFLSVSEGHIISVSVERLPKFGNLPTALVSLIRMSL
jgi:divalent metal cation (Fe/Co/Zn/Cd) transporter